MPPYIRHLTSENYALPGLLTLLLSVNTIKPKILLYGTVPRLLESSTGHQTI